jgi:phosphoketolase
MAIDRWEVIVRDRAGRRFPARHVHEDIEEPERFRAHLLAIARLEDTSNATPEYENWIGEYELEVKREDDAQPRHILRWLEGSTDTPDWWTVILRDRKGERYPARLVHEDIRQHQRFREHLVAIARVEDRSNATAEYENWVGHYELEVKLARVDSQSAPAFIFRWQD